MGQLKTLCIFILGHNDPKLPVQIPIPRHPHGWNFRYLDFAEDSHGRIHSWQMKDPQT